MFGLDLSELLIIAVVALVVVGPKELPQLLRTVGQWVGKARRMAGEFQTQMNEAIREAELDDVKKHVDDLRALSPKALLASQLASVTETLDRVEKDTQAEFAAIGSERSIGGAAVAAPEAAPGEAATAEAERAAVAEIDAAASTWGDTARPGQAGSALAAFTAPEPEPVEAKREPSA